MTRILTAGDVSSLLTTDDCLHAVEEVFRGYGEGRVAAPRSLGVHAENGTFHVKAALSDHFAAKVNANFPSNPQRHALPAIQGVIVLMGAGDGTLLAILDSTVITALRTAAATAVAVRHLARADAHTMTVIGCGTQGRAHIEAIRRVRPIAKVHACDADEDAATRFAQEMGTLSGLHVVATSSIEEAVAASDIVVTCTPSRNPLLGREHLHRGLLLAGVGADNPEKHELSPELLRHSLVVPDILEQAAAMGDLHHAIAAGVLTPEDIHGELAAVVSGRVAGRTAEDEIFVFDSTGTALQDVAVASVAYARAVEQGVGVDVALR